MVQQPDDEILRQIIERRRALQQPQPKSSGGLGGLLEKAGKSAFNVAWNNPLNVIGRKAVSEGFNAIGDFSKAVENEPVEKVLAVPAIRRALQGKQPFWFDASKEELAAPNIRLGTPKQVATRNIRTYTDELSEAAGRTPLAGGVAGTGTRLAGRGVEGAAGLLLDPTNLLGIGLARKGKLAAEAGVEGAELAAANSNKAAKLLEVGAELFGRGTQSKKAYLAAQAAAGFGSGVGGELAGQPGAIIGGFGGGFAGVSAMDRARRVAERNAFEAARTTAERENLVGYSEDAVNGIKASDARYPIYKTSEGNRKVVDQSTLSQQISGRRAAERNMQIPEATRLSMKEDTDALEALLNVMRGRFPKLTVENEFDAGRNALKFFRGTEDTGRSFLEASQAAQRAADIEKGAETFGDYRFAPETEGKLADLIKGTPAPETPEEMLTLYHGTENPDAMEMLARGEVRPGTFLTSNRELAATYGPNVYEVNVPKSKLQSDDLQMFGGKPTKNYTYLEGSQFASQQRPTIESTLAQERDLRAQLGMSKEAEPQFRTAHKEADTAKKAYQKEIVDQFPKGARTAANNYLKALVQGGDVKATFERLQRVSKMDLTGLDEAAAHFVDLHHAERQAKAELDDLLKSRTDLGAAHGNAQAAAKKMVEDQFGSAVRNLQGKLLQIKGQGGLYRVKSFGVKDGQLGADLEYVSPKKSIEEAITEGADATSGRAAALRDARQRVQDLRREQAQLRRSGEDVGDIAERIKAAESEARSLELVRPVGGERPTGTRFVPLSDTTEFSVLKPGKAATARSLADAGIKDARTVRLLNQESAARANARVTEQNLQILQSQREKLDPMDPRAAQLDEAIAGTQSQLDVQNAEIERINGIVAGNQQALEATIQAARDDAAAKQLAHEANVAARDAAWEELTKSLAISPEAANRRFLDNVRDTDDVLLNQLQGKTDKRLTQGAYDQMIDEFDEMVKRNVSSLPKPAQEAYGNLYNYAEELIHEGHARNAIARIDAPKMGNGLNHIDPDAWRNGLGGWFRRSVMGTGFQNAEVEDLAAAHFNGQSAAAQMADITYGALERESARVNDRWLGNLGDIAEGGTPEQLAKSAWARSVQAISDPLERNAAILRNAAKPITDQYWVKQLGDIPEEYRQQIYDTLAGNFLYASHNPGAFDYASLDPSFANTLGHYGRNIAGVEKYAGSKGLVRNLLKSDYREYAPVGRIPLADGSIKELKAGERTIATDLYEILAKAANDPKNLAKAQSGIPAPVPTLEEMLIPTREWGVTQAANVLNKVNDNSTWEKVSGWLKDPKAVDILKRGSEIAPNEWKDPSYASEWGKMRDILLPTKPTGVYRWLDNAAQAMNKVAASTITGDASFSTVQGLIGMAMSPASTAKLLKNYWRNALSDEGWAVQMADPEFRTKLIDRTNRGMGIGRSSVTGVDSGGNLFQEIPGLKRFGNAMAKLDMIAFDRMQTLNKMNLIDTMEADVQMIRAFGQGVGQQFVDGIPSLDALNKHVNLWQSTPEDISNGIIRLANNSLGGLSKSQSLLGRNRQALESTLLFVPGFFRARGGLINSVSKMLRNPDSPEGYLAASLIAREALFRVAFAASIAEITGTSDEFRKEADSWAALDPRKSGGILSGPLGDGGYLGLSWGNSAPKLYAQLLAGSKPGEFNLSPQDRLNSIRDFFEGRTNPVIGAVMEQVQGKDFLGRPVQTPRDRIVSALQTVTPMFIANTVGEANEAQHAGNFDPKTLGATSLLEFAGLNVRQPLPSQQLDSAFQRWQEQNFPGEPTTSWRNAPSALKNMARDDKTIADLEEKSTSEMARRVSESASQRDIVYRAWDEKNQGFDNAISKLSQQLSAGQIDPETFKESYGSLQEDRADAAADFRAVLAKAGVQPKDEVGSLGQSGSQLAHLMAEYNAIKPQTISGEKITESGVVPDNDIDWTRFKQERAAVLAKYPEQVQAQFKATQTPDDPNVRRLQDSREVLDTYFDQLPKYRGLSNIEGKTLDAYKAVLNAAASQYSNLGIKFDRNALMLQKLQQMERDGQISNPRQAQIAALALRVAQNPQFATSIRNLGAIQFLLQNPDAFEWYPWLASEIPSALRPLLNRGARTVDTNSILQQNLRGADLASVR